MNMRMKSSGRLRSSGSIARSISGRAKTRKIEDNRPLSEAYRVLQQKMGDCPPSPVFSCVPGYGGERTSPHSSVAQGEGVVQRKIEVKGMEATAIEGAVEKFILRFPEEQRKALQNIYDDLKKNEIEHSFNSTEQLFWEILQGLEESKSAEVEDEGQPYLNEAPGINPDLNYIPETETHVGFEIELGKDYFFPSDSYDEIDKLTNKTLAVFYIDEGFIKELKAKSLDEKRERASLKKLAMSNHLLEMLIDDVSLEGKEGKKKVKAQVEFRTTPLAFGCIGLWLKNVILAAIREFSVTILARGGMVMNTTCGCWESRGQFTYFPEGGEKKMELPKNLVQHATLSIELEAFAKLAKSGVIGREYQKKLVPYLEGCESRQEIVDRFFVFLRRSQDKFKNGVYIDATTGGRNKAGSRKNFSKTEQGDYTQHGICFKSPLEALFAADRSLKIKEEYGNNIAKKVKYGDIKGDNYEFSLLPIKSVVKNLLRNRKFPKMQGEGGIGYRVVGEKLQPLLLDSMSGMPRMLVEHREGALVKAMNEALAGTKTNFKNITAAAKAMDDARKELILDSFVREFPRREKPTPTLIKILKDFEIPIDLKREEDMRMFEKSNREIFEKQERPDEDEKEEEKGKDTDNPGYIQQAEESFRKLEEQERLKRMADLD